MRYEFGDRLETLTYTPGIATPEPDPAPAPKTDHRARFLAFATDTGDVTFEIPPCDPVTEEPLSRLTVVFYPVGVGLPTTAAEFIDLPDADYPKSQLDLVPGQFGATVTLPRPDAMQPGVPYLGQAIHGYAS